MPDITQLPSLVVGGTIALSIGFIVLLCCCCCCFILCKHLKVAHIGEIETLDLKASIFLLFNALQILAALICVLFVESHKAVSVVALAPSRATCEKRQDDLATHADDPLGNRHAATLDGLGIGEFDEGRRCWDFVRVCGVRVVHG